MVVHLSANGEYFGTYGAPHVESIEMIQAEWQCRLLLPLGLQLVISVKLPPSLVIEVFEIHRSWIQVFCYVLSKYSSEVIKHYSLYSAYTIVIL